MTSERRPTAGWLYDDLLAWLSPGGLLLTALALRFPRGLQLLRAQAPELTLPTWLAGTYVVGLALSPLGRCIRAVDVLAGNAGTWTASQVAAGVLGTSLAMVAAVIASAGASGPSCPSGAGFRFIRQT